MSTTQCHCPVQRYAEDNFILCRHKTRCLVAPSTCWIQGYNEDAGVFADETIVACSLVQRMLSMRDAKFVQACSYGRLIVHATYAALGPTTWCHCCGLQHKCACDICFACNALLLWRLVICMKLLKGLEKSMCEGHAKFVQNIHDWSWVVHSTHGMRNKREKASERER